MIKTAHIEVDLKTKFLKAIHYFAELNVKISPFDMSHESFNWSKQSCRCPQIHWII